MHRNIDTNKVELVYFALAADGTPALHQRKMFSAAFLVIAFGQTALATGRKDLRDEAIELLEVILSWINSPTLLGKPSLPGLPVLEPLNVPMILLNIISELMEGLSSQDRSNFYPKERAWAIQNILKHVSEKHQCTFEFV